MAWELANTNPFEDLEEARSEMDRLWDAFLFGRPMKAGAGEEEPVWLPAVDVTETKDEIIVNCEIPGIDPKDLEVSLRERILTIKGEKKQEEEREVDYRLLERSYGTFIRLIPIPTEVKEDRTSASYKNGVLRVVLPKSEGAKKAMKIKIE